MKSVPSWKRVDNFTCTNWLVNQFNMTMTSVFTCTIHCELVAMSPSGGKQQLCVWFVLPTCAIRPGCPKFA